VSGAVGYYLFLGVIIGAVIWNFGKITLRVHREYRDSIIKQDFFDTLLNAIVNGK